MKPNMKSSRSFCSILHSSFMWHDWKLFEILAHNYRFSILKLTWKNESPLWASNSCVVCCALVVLGALPFSSYAQLDPSFYKERCPRVHPIVHQVIRNVSNSDPRMHASLLRLHQHDCFVQVRLISSSFWCH